MTNGSGPITLTPQENSDRLLLLTRAKTLASKIDKQIEVEAKQVPPDDLGIELLNRIKKALKRLIDRFDVGESGGIAGGALFVEMPPPPAPRGLPPAPPWREREPPTVGELHGEAVVLGNDFTEWWGRVEKRSSSK